MLQPAQPRHDALDAHAEARMRHAPVPPQVEVPLECFLRQLVLANPFEQQCVVVQTLSAADDLPVALRGEHVDRQRQLRPLGVRLHVEGLDRGGKALHGDRTVEVSGQSGLVRAAEILAPLERKAAGLENLDRLVVGDAGERRAHPLERGRVPFEYLQLAGPPLEHPLDDGDDERLRQVRGVVEGSVGHLRLDHPELGQMAPRLRFLGAKRRPEAVDPSQRHRVGLVVELAALREIGRRVVEVRDREQRRGSLAGGRGEDGRVRQDEAAAVEEVADAVDDLVPHAQDRRLPPAADPQVTPIEEIVDAVFLGGDRVVVRLADHGERRHVDLVAAGRARILPDGPLDDQRRLLAEMVGPLERFVADGGLRNHGLHESAAVAQREEVDLPARASPLQPPADGDFPADVVGNRLDGRRGRPHLHP